MSDIKWFGLVKQITFPPTRRLNNYFPAVGTILLYKFRDPSGSGKVNTKTNTEAETSLTAGK